VRNSNWEKPQQLTCAPCKAAGGERREGAVTQHLPSWPAWVAPWVARWVLHSAVRHAVAPLGGRTPMRLAVVTHR